MSFVSILIPCFNAEKWIGQSIESALAQTWLEKEVIVVDDGSTDGSLEIIKDFGNRIKIETGPNLGGNVARNRLLKLAHGEWLQYLDADDYLLPKKIGDQLVDIPPRTDIIFGRVIQESLVNGKASQNLALAPRSLDPWCLLVQWELPQTGAVIMRKAALEDVGGWKVDQPCCQEHELYLRLLCAGKRFFYTSSYGAVYRQWPSGSVSRRDVFDVLRHRLKIIRQTEHFLHSESQLSPERLGAINQAKLEVARTAWRYDANFAAAIVNEIHKRDARFSPGALGARISYSWSYKVAYRLFGFDRAERIASLVRRRTAF
jgi:glycosyltransferase involved in cell wall biosynthesis